MNLEEAVLLLVIADQNLQLLPLPLALLQQPLAHLKVQKGLERKNEIKSDHSRIDSEGFGS